MKAQYILIFILIPAMASSQVILDEYLKEGLANNLTLSQKSADYKKSLEALKQARGLFFPNVSVGARYTVSQGGRVIEFPVGTLLNPVYSTLNSLTASSMFPMVSDMEIKFLRPTEHETRVRLVQPVFNTDLYYNSKIHRELAELFETDVAQYRRELVAEIKKSYFDLSSATSAVKIFVDTRALLAENLRVSRKLVENGKATHDVIFRSEAELSSLEQDLIEAEGSRKVAAAYFNFLINRPLTDSVTIQPTLVFPAIRDLVAAYSGGAADKREEVRKLELYNEIAGLQVKQGQADRLPELFIAVDYGFQGEKYRFNMKNDYMQASAVLSWTLFNGFQTRSKIRQSELDREIAGKKLEEVKKQIELEVLNVLNNLLAAEKGIITAEQGLVSAKEGFRLTGRKYGEGQASLIEYIDARSALTRAELNLVLCRNNYLRGYAEFEKVTSMNKY